MRPLASSGVVQLMVIVLAVAMASVIFGGEAASKENNISKHILYRDTRNKTSTGTQGTRPLYRDTRNKTSTGTQGT